MSEKRIVMMGHAVEFSTMYQSIKNMHYSEKVDFIFLNKQSEISINELKICEKADLLFAFVNSYAEAKHLYKSLGCEINKKCIFLLEKKENHKDCDDGFEDKLIQWLYQNGTKKLVLQMIIKMLCKKSYIVEPDLSQILKISLDAPKFKSEIIVYKGKKEEVVRESEYFVNKNVNKKCKFLSIVGSLTLNEVVDIYDIYRNESNPEYIISYEAEEECEVFLLIM